MITRREIKGSSLNSYNSVKCFRSPYAARRHSRAARRHASRLVRAFLRRLLRRDSLTEL